MSLFYFQRVAKIGNYASYAANFVKWIRRFRIGCLIWWTSYDPNIFQLDQYEDFIPETTPIRKLVSHTGGIYKFALHPSQKGVFASCSVDCSVKVWNIGQTLKVRANSAVRNLIQIFKGSFTNNVYKKRG